MVKSRVQVGPLLDNNGVLLDSEKDKTSSLNNYFAAVFTSEDSTDIPIPTAMTSSDYIAHLQDVHFSVEDGFTVNSYPKSTRTKLTRTQVNSYPRSTRTQVKSYPRSTRTQIQKKRKVML